jgi:hypothetical protein
MITRGSEWHRWEPHIHAPATILNNQFGADPWAGYLTTLAALTPTIEAIAVTELAGHQDLGTTQRYSTSVRRRSTRPSGCSRARTFVEESWRRRENWARRPSFIGKSGGGAGICTRVRKYIPAGIYDAYPPLSCRARREEAEQPPGTNPGKSRG